MTNEMATVTVNDALERIIAQGDLGTLTPEQRTAYYRAVCESLGLNPLTRPFEYIRLQGKLTLYARRDAADQLRGCMASRSRLSTHQGDDLHAVTAREQPRWPRRRETGAVSGWARGGRWRTRSKAGQVKRRVTLSLCGLGWSDETEVETIPNARRVAVDADGVIAEPQLPEPSDKPHWIDDERARRRFWAWTSETLGLSSRDVYTALGVEQVHDYAGSMADAKAAIESYVANYAGAATEEGEG